VGFIRKTSLLYSPSAAITTSKSIQDKHDKSNTIARTGYPQVRLPVIGSVSCVRTREDGEQTLATRNPSGWPWRSNAGDGKINTADDDDDGSSAAGLSWYIEVRKVRGVVGVSQVAFCYETVAVQLPAQQRPSPGARAVSLLMLFNLIMVLAADKSIVACWCC
jgi:hypothetical protein